MVRASIIVHHAHATTFISLDTPLVRTPPIAPLRTAQNHARAISEAPSTRALARRGFCVSRASHGTMLLHTQSHHSDDSLTLALHGRSQRRPACLRSVPPVQLVRRSPYIIPSAVRRRRPNPRHRPPHPIIPRQSHVDLHSTNIYSKLKRASQ